MLSLQSSDSMMVYDTLQMWAKKCIRLEAYTNLAKEKTIY